MKSEFVHLHTHSHYSLLQALPKIPELVKAAKNDGQTALALTDVGNLYGAIEFYKECAKHDIKPIIGVDFHVARRTRHDKDAGIDNRGYRLVLLAENNEGYRNIIKLVTASYTEGFYYKPRIDRELLEKYNTGLIAIFPSTQSETSSALKRHRNNEAEKKIRTYKETLGKDSVFLEITHHHDIPTQKTLQKEIVELGTRTNTRLLATHNVYYLKPDDKLAFKTLRSIQSSVGYKEQAGLTDVEEDFSFITSEQAHEYFRNIPEAVTQTSTLAQRCAVDLTLGKSIFPEFTIPNDTTYNKELKRLTYAGLKRRKMEKTKEVEERIEYELGIIKDKGYAPYFLIVADLLRFAQQNNIYTNTRGSASGSLVSYCLGITNIDPLLYRLPFERFLNPERPTAPDIDMDIADNRRDEVIAYARDKYGEKNVAQIGTFGTMLARGSVRDTARALGYDYTTGDRIAKLIPLGSQGFPMTIERALKEEAELRGLYDSDEDTRKIIDMAKKIEGCARHISVHAAGVVISPVPLTDLVPLQPEPKNREKLITQYDMYSVADEYGGVGLVKFDFLGLKNLAVLADSVKRVEKLLGEKVDVRNLPLDDEKTFAMLARGRTIGVFQLAGSGMTRYLKDLKPTTIHDINAMVALYRPGPMEFIPEYIKRKNEPETIDYPHESLTEDLKQSLGLLIYQEDVMLTAIKLASYSWLEADKFRKAMGKKIPKLMAEQEERFKSGCVENGIAEETADDLWRRITPFAAYAFNKAHASSYGYLAYQTAYMKANYPVIYMASLLTADAGDVDKIAEIIGECDRMSIEVLPPDINESLCDFSVVFDDNNTPVNIRFGLHSIKNFGHGVADSIIAERKKGGRFTSLADLLERVTDKNFNKKGLESLIKCGALDEFGERGTMLANLDGLLEHSRAANNKPENQDSLFELFDTNTHLPELTLTPAEPADDEERLSWEKELLGLYVSGHPLDRFKEKITDRDWDIKRAKEELEPGTNTEIIGVIEESKSINTKNGERMAFLRISDYTGSIEVVIFPKLYRSCAETIGADQCVTIQGTMSDRKGDTSLLANKVVQLK